MIGAEGPVVTEGPFARNRLFLGMLATAIDRPVTGAGESATGTSIGAALLTRPACVGAGGVGSAGDSAGWPSRRLRAAVAPGGHFGSIRVIFEPSSVAPAIRPFWPKTKATMGSWMVLVVASASTPLPITATLASTPASKPLLLSR